MDNFCDVYKAHGLRTERGYSPKEIFLTEKFSNFNPVSGHPDFDTVDLQEETIYQEYCEFAQNVSPDTLVDDGNSGKNAYLHLLNAIQDSVVQFFRHYPFGFLHFYPQFIIRLVAPSYFSCTTFSDQLWKLRYSTLEGIHKIKYLC